MKVEDGVSMLLWNDSWLDESILEACFSRLVELANNKLTTAAEM